MDVPSFVRRIPTYPGAYCQRSNDDPPTRDSVPTQHVALMLLPCS